MWIVTYTLPSLFRWWWSVLRTSGHKPAEVLAVSELLQSPNRPIAQSPTGRHPRFFAGTLCVGDTCRDRNGGFPLTWRRLYRSKSMFVRRHFIFTINRWFVWRLSVGMWKLWPPDVSLVRFVWRKSQDSRYKFSKFYYIQPYNILKKADFIGILMTFELSYDFFLMFLRLYMGLIGERETRAPLIFESHDSPA